MSIKMKDLPEGERPYEKLEEKGAKALSDSELLAIIIKNGTKNETSVQVTFKHRIGNKDLGTIGIIGPKRMDYAKVISVMKYISKKLNDTSNDGE